jgi:hypothetical protein
MEAALLFPEPAAGEPYTILIMHATVQYDESMVKLDNNAVF